MAALIIIGLIFLFLFLLWWYIESSFWYIYKSDTRKIGNTPVPLRYKIVDIVVGFLFTIGRWVGAFTLISIPLSFMVLFRDKNALLYHQYEAFWWTLTAILDISILWFFYLRGLIERCKQIESTPYAKPLFPKIRIQFDNVTWLILLIIVPLTSMLLSQGKSSDFYFDLFNLPASQYETNNTIFSQILQEVANTDAHVRSTRMSVEYGFRELSNRLYKTIIAGIISATAMLGLLIIYRTRKPDENK